MDESFTNLYEYVGSNDFFDYSEIQHSLNAPPRTIMENREKIQKNPEMAVKDYLVAFSTQTQNYCVGLVDMVDSTRISARIGPARISRYYQIFLNSMSRILTRFGGFVIKNVGDCLFYYFPESSRTDSKFGFLSCLEASLAMVESHDLICQHLKKEGLPCVDYRISADYGKVIIMKASTSSSLDMIGPPVNMCSKINRLASKNGIVLGGDLKEMVKDYKDYSYKEIKGFSLGFKQQYPVYSLLRRR